METRFKKVILTGGMVTAFSVTTAFAGMPVEDETTEKMLAEYEAVTAQKDNIAFNVTVDEMLDGKFANVTEEPSLEISNLSLVTSTATTSLKDTESVDVGVESVLASGSEVTVQEAAVENTVDTQVAVVDTQEIVAENTVDTQDAVQDEESASEEAGVWDNLVIAKVDESLNIRSQADSSAEVIGQLGRGCVGEILEQGEEWTKISSGKVEGYVSNQYILTGTEAEAFANDLDLYQAEVTTDILRVRMDASTEAGILGAVAKGDRLVVIDDVSNPEWMMVQFGQSEGFVSKEYVAASYKFSYAKTMEEIQAEAARVAAMNSSRSAAVDLSADEVTMIAAMIQCEAGGESFKGKVAVGNVILNRVKSSRYPSTIKGVLTQRGQFGPYSSGKWQRVLKNGVSKECIKAAKEAMSGTNYVGNAKSFNNKRCGRKGTVIGNHVFW